MRKVLSIAIGLTALSVLAFSHPVTASARAASTATASTTGYDVSWPQCPSSFPRGGAFGIVGVTSGRPWSVTSCLRSEYSWALARPGAPAFYMNTANPAPHSSYYWPASGASDPVLCADNTSTTDAGCAYDYGWHAAADALTKAKSVTSSAAQRTWWLDVEIANSWNGDGHSNAADLQGSIDALRSLSVPKVGLYSTAYQWNTVTGGYTIATEASYASAWGFSSPNGLDLSPDWVAGATSASEAASLCSSSFTGATTALAQYPSGGFDADLICSPTAPPSSNPDYSLAATPSSVTAAPGSSVSSTISVSSSGGWTGSVQLNAGSSRGGVTARFTGNPVASSGSTTLTLSAASPGSYTVTVTATPSSGSTTSTQHTVVIDFTVSSPTPTPPPPPPGGDNCDNC